jgi:lysozyme
VSMLNWIASILSKRPPSRSSDTALQPIQLPRQIPPPASVASFASPHRGLSRMTIDRIAMIRQLRLHEGERLKPYRCTAGKLTIGIGRNLEDRGITAEESAYLLGNDIDHHWRELLRALPWVASLDSVRQRVLLDMAFNLGITGMLGFKNTLATIQAGNYQRGAEMMLQSKWAGQVGQRAVRLSRMMATGKEPQELR